MAKHSSRAHSSRKHEKEKQKKVSAIIKQLQSLINPYLSKVRQQALSVDKIDDLLDALISQYEFCKSSNHSLIHRSYRLIAEILKDHRAHFNQKILLEFLNEVETWSGSVPQEVNNEHIHLPDEAFLPPFMKSSAKKSTLDSWKRISWSDPSRGDNDEKVSFFAGPKIIRDGEETNSAAVRQHLIHYAKKDEETKNVLSYYGAKFMSARLLEADHLQPNADILARQKEMIECMNISSSYRENILSTNKDKGFFIEDKQGCIFGTKYFFMLFHNCINNLWLICADSNKRDQCPIQWLGNNKDFFGQAFFDEHGPINKNTLLYTTKGGELLAQAAKQYFDREHAHRIMLSRQAQRLSYDFDQGVASVSENGSSREKISFIATTFAATALATFHSGYSGNNIELDDDLSNSSLDDNSSGLCSDDATDLLEDFKGDLSHHHFQRVAVNDSSVHEGLKNVKRDISSIMKRNKIPEPEKAVFTLKNEIKSSSDSLRKASLNVKRARKAALNHESLYKQCDDFHSDLCEVRKKAKILSREIKNQRKESDTSESFKKEIDFSDVNTNRLMC